MSTERLEEIVRQADEIRTLRTRVAKVEQERDEAIRRITEIGQMMAAHINSATARAEAAESSLRQSREREAGLREALERLTEIYEDSIDPAERPDWLRTALAPASAAEGNSSAGLTSSPAPAPEPGGERCRKCNGGGLYHWNGVLATCPCREAQP